MPASWPLRVPERLAVADKTESFTYAQLEEKSNQIASSSPIGRGH
jgi:non-ribosomal peptide synthetase component E (peptide arylation enzyme)